jgi:hypothetical protein
MIRQRLPHAVGPEDSGNPIRGFEAAGRGLPVSQP